MLVGGVWVSTPLHTLIALVRAAAQAPAPAPAKPPAPRTGAAAHADPRITAARARVGLRLADPAEAVAWLAARPRMPGKRAARTLLLELRAQAQTQTPAQEHPHPHPQTHPQLNPQAGSGVPA